MKLYRSKSADGAATWQGAGMSPKRIWLRRERRTGDRATRWRFQSKLGTLLLFACFRSR